MVIIIVMSKMKEADLNDCIYDILTLLNQKEYTNRQLIIKVGELKKYSVSKINYAMNFLKSFEYINTHIRCRRHGRPKTYITQKGINRLREFNPTETCNM